MILIPKITNIHSFAHVVFSGTALRVKRALTLSAVLICLLAALSGVAVAQDQASCTAYLATNPNPSGIPAVSGSGVAQRNALDHGWSMCDEMPYGESFVNTHGGSTTLYKDPTGTHHSLPSSATPREQMFDFLVASTATPTPIPTPSIIWRHQGDGKVYGMTTNGSTVTSGAQFWQETNPAWSIVGQGDFDGDGVRDLAWWNSSNGQVYLMLMSGPTAVKSGAIVYTEANTAWKIVATGDINGDGKSDLIWWNSSTGQVYAMLMNGTATTGGAIIYTEPNTAWKIVSAADFDANGSVDLLWWNSTTGQAALGRTNGISASTAGIIWTEPNTDWRIAGAGDLDGDGKADIVWHNRTTGQVYGMQTNGSSVTNGAMMYTEPNTQWEIVSVGNYNGDNKADLLWWNQQTGQLYVMPMNGLSVASGGSLLYTEPDLTWHIQGETEWRDNVYGKGVTTTSASGSVAAGVSIEVDTAQVGGAVRDLFGVNKNPRASQFVGSSNMYNVSALYQQLGVSHVRTHDCGLDLCGTYKDATLYDMTTATPTVLTGTCTAAGVNAPPQLKWNVNNAADVNNPDNYNFTEVDRVIANALEAGAAVYLRLGQTFNGPSMTDDPDAWSKVAVNIYKHVIGQFKPSGVSVDPVAVEVYNEPDGGFWKGSKSDFMIYFNNTVDGVRGAAAAAGKSLRIGGPGFTNELVNHSTTTQNVASTFVETATLGRLDFLSAHHYNGCSNATLARAADWFDSVRALLASKGYPQSKPLDVSEYNIGLGNTCGNSFFSEAQVQSFTSGILTLMQGVNEWNIERAMFYSGFPLMGLMTVNASITGVVTVNPSAWALWAHSQLKGGTLVSAVTCVNNSSCVSGKAAASSSIVALAAKMSAGGYRIIVTNMTGEEKTYSLNLKGLTTSSAGIQIRTPLTTAQTVAAVKSGSDYYPTTSAITGLMATISTRSLTLPVLSGTATSSSLTLPAWSLNVIDVAP